MAERRAHGRFSSPLSRLPARRVLDCISSRAASTLAKIRAISSWPWSGAPIFRGACSGSCKIQAGCAFLLSLAVFLAARNPVAFPAPTDIAGAVILVSAIAGEAWSDATLARFRATRGPGRSVCMEGPWAWSRHPNYFFQWLNWAGFAVVAIDFSGAWPQGWLAMLAPAFMYWLLAHVSGVPPLEKHMLASRGDAFRAYQARVNVFFPGPQKRL